MTTEALYALFPDSKRVPDGDLSMNRSVAAFSKVVRNLRTEISVTDCKVYSISPRNFSHRHEFTMVVANVDGKVVQVIFQCMETIKTDTAESTVTVHLGPIQAYFAHHFDMSSLPKYTWHLTWQGGDYPKLHRVAEIAKRISNRIETDVEENRIKPHQCSLFSRSLLAVMATSFPGYERGPPECVDAPRRRSWLRSLLYFRFDSRDSRKPNHEVLRIAHDVLRELNLPQIHTQTRDLLAEF